MSDWRSGYRDDVRETVRQRRIRFREAMARIGTDAVGLG